MTLIFNGRKAMFDLHDALGKLFFDKPGTTYLDLCPKVLAVSRMEFIHDPADPQGFVLVFGSAIINGPRRPRPYVRCQRREVTDREIRRTMDVLELTWAVVVLDEGMVDDLHPRPRDAIPPMRVNIRHPQCVAVLQRAELSARSAHHRQGW